MPVTTANQAHVDAGLARAVGNLILHYDAPAAPFINLRDAICSNYGYQEEIDGEPNPESKKAFADRKIKEMLKAIEKSYRVRQAGTAATTAEHQTPDVDLE